MLVQELFEHLDKQTRVDIGQSTQQLFARAFKRRYPGSKIISISPSSSQSEDIIVDLDGEKLQIEVKTRQAPNRTNVVYSKSIRRNDSDEIFDAFAKDFSSGKILSFTELIDSYRKKNREIGFPDDESVPKSGKIPSEFKTTSENFLSALRTFVASFYAAKKDNYFTIFDASTNLFYVFFTGYGPNPLGASKFPSFSSAMVDTYGSGYKGSMRVAVKAIINVKSSKVKISTQSLSKASIEIGNSVRT